MNHDPEFRAQVMRLVFNQPLPSSEVLPPIRYVEDMLEALQKGWEYDAAMGMQLLDHFGTWDMDNRKSGGCVFGTGAMVRAPDGAVLESGEDLVAWRDARWARMRAEALEQAMPEVKQRGTRRRM